ncbi:hypothetical protein JOF56_008213 [Kibdelosporangium banguiense]|uniref:PLL-like beta propeller domain-containing protein n=1 Tax=Kibdelosporangium banguiense TaxID=1365924 RepID=A0ABS4TTV0_9PSEU|nr:hypothetical protein [Kibdelosporangium banguiense]MBP2327828.1 hypothetical protein [Kibdelosporangium banguiense]
MFRRLLSLGLMGLFLASVVSVPAAASATEAVAKADVGILSKTVPNCDGRWEEFRRNGNILEHRWQYSAGGSWSGWASLGGVSISSPWNEFLSDGRARVCRFDIGFVGYCRTQSAPGQGPWTAWARA